MHKEKTYKFFSKLLFANPLYSLTLLGKTQRNLKIIPPCPWPGNTNAGEKILKNDSQLFLKYCKKKITANFEKNNDLHAYYEVHSFDWINNLHSIGSDKSREVARKLVLSWIKNNNHWKYFAWSSELIARRIVNLFGRFNFFCSSANEEFKSIFFTNIMKQIRHLYRVIDFQPSGSSKITAAKGLIYAGICLEESKNYLKKGMNCLEKEIKKQILTDGGHLDRNPSIHILVLKDLIDIRASITAANLKIPKILQTTINKMAPIVSLVRHSNGRLSLFNASNEGDEALIEKISARSSALNKKIFSAKSFGFEKIDKNKTAFILDVGTPTKGTVGAIPHAGSLSFEMSHGKEKIITNCGSFGSMNKKWGLAQRSTAAHSTLCLENTNSSAMRPNGSLGNRIAKVKNFRNDQKNFTTISCQHDGYLEKFGIIHNRHITLTNNGETLIGKDTLIFQERRGGEGKELSVKLHFHLHPEVKALKLGNQRSVLLTLLSRNGWRFEIDEGPIQLEKSIYLGKKEKQKTDQIVITRKINSELKENNTLHWKITKLSNKPHQ